MPDIALLDPRVLNGVIDRMPPADGLMGLSMIPRSSYDLPVWEYDIRSRRRNIARPNTPNSPAHIVSQDGLGHMAGTFIYTREKKVFEPTTLRWLRAPGQMAAAAAEAAVLNEMQDLNARIDRFHEFLFWQMVVTGTLDISDLGYQQSIDYGIDASHLPTMATPWNTVGANVVRDIQDLKRIVTRDTEASLKGVFANGVTLETFWSQTQVQSMLTEADRGRYAVEGTLNRFQGMAWNEYDRGYSDDFTNPASPTFVPYIPNGYMVMIAPEGRPYEAFDGPAADDEAPIGHTGRFSKTWKEKDPSSRQILIESNFIPILRNPDQIVVAKIY